MRKFNIRVNGKEYDVEVEELKKDSSGNKKETKEIIKETSRGPGEETKKTESIVGLSGEEVIEAPMPGTILSINVSVGDRVEEGDVLLILEAMKMENEILSPVSGEVKAIGINTGKIVNTGEKLIIIQ